jgi:hypothetical protein
LPGSDLARLSNLKDAIADPMTKTESTLEIKLFYIIKNIPHTSRCLEDLGVFIVFSKPYGSGKQNQLPNHTIDKKSLSI